MRRVTWALFLCLPFLFFILITTLAWELSLILSHQLPLILEEAANPDYINVSFSLEYLYLEHVTYVRVCGARRSWLVSTIRNLESRDYKWSDSIIFAIGVLSIRDFRTSSMTKCLNSNVNIHYSRVFFYIAQYVDIKAKLSKCYHQSGSLGKNSDK